MLPPQVSTGASRHYNAELRRPVEWTARHGNAAVTRWRTQQDSPHHDGAHCILIKCSRHRGKAILPCNVPELQPYLLIRSFQQVCSAIRHKLHLNHTVCSFLATAFGIAPASGLSNRENRCALLTVVTSSHWIIFREKSAPTVDLYVSENTLSTKRLMIEVLPHAALPTTMIL